MLEETSKLDRFIAALYAATHNIHIGDFRAWALNELKEVIDFDTCLWATGHARTRSFNTVTTIGLPNAFAVDLLACLPLNPITKRLFEQPCTPVDMREVVDDAVFYNSEIYTEVFGVYGIERILSSLHIDKESGVYTVLSLYRGDRDSVFIDEEKKIHASSLFHLMTASAIAGTASLLCDEHKERFRHAICDKSGVYHTVEPEFKDLMLMSFPDCAVQHLPFSIHERAASFLERNLVVKIEKMGELYRVSAREKTVLDVLTHREFQVVRGVTQGLSFKQIARTLGLSPSTVSNHLYRVYDKLNINSRMELAELVGQNSGSVENGAAGGSSDSA